MINSYDVFISHSSQDKNDYVEDLKKSFEKLGITIFYDKDTIKWGDNWKKKIYDGLDSCTFAVIIISENFYDRKWTEEELYTLLKRQNKNGVNIILPILYHTTLEEMKHHYKKLSDIQFLDSKNFDVKDITILLAERLLENQRIINIDKTEEDNNYKMIKYYCENDMSNSYKFFIWLKSLINHNDFIDAYNNNLWIGWEYFNYNGIKMSLFQTDNKKYRIDPKYYSAFVKYFNNEIKKRLI